MYYIYYTLYLDSLLTTYSVSSSIKPKTKTYCEPLYSFCIGNLKTSCFENSSLPPFSQLLFEKLNTTFDLFQKCFWLITFKRFIYFPECTYSPRRKSCHLEFLKIGSLRQLRCMHVPCKHYMQ